MKRIVFVTKSETNFGLAKKFINDKKIALIKWSSSQAKLEEGNLQDIISHKANLAYAKVQEPCFVVESSFMIEALNDFPGIHTQYILDSIGTEGILKLMEGKENRRCIYRRCLCFHDGNQLHYFFCDEKGTILEHKSDLYPPNKLESIFVPEDYEDKTKPILAFHPCCIEQFSNYLNDHLTKLMEDPYHEN